MTYSMRLHGQEKAVRKRKMQGFKSPIDSWVVKVVVGAHGAIRVGTHRATGAGIENTDENSN